MVRVGTVAIDSTKLAANASLSANRSYEGLRREAERILEEAADTDAREDALWGDAGGDELPEDLADARTRPERVRQLLGEFQTRERELKAKHARVQAEHAERKRTTGRGRRGRPPSGELTKQERKQLYETKRNLTDPDSGIVRYRGQKIQGYSVHTAVGDGQVILATRVTGVSPDHGQLAPTLTKTTAILQRLGITDPVADVLADSGYWSTQQIRDLQATGVRVLVPPVQRHAKHPDNEQPEVRAMRATLDTEEGKRAYKRRAAIVEPVYAQIRHNRGIARILRRRQAAVQAEIDLIATGYNLLKLFHRPAPAT
jgi:hypothetical protein